MLGTQGLESPRFTWGIEWEAQRTSPLRLGDPRRALRAPRVEGLGCSGEGEARAEQDGEGMWGVSCLPVSLWGEESLAQPHYCYPRTVDVCEHLNPQPHSTETVCSAPGKVSLLSPRELSPGSGATPCLPSEYIRRGSLISSFSRCILFWMHLLQKTTLISSCTCCFNPCTEAALACQINEQTRNL